MDNPLIWWQEWWRGLTLVERVVVFLLLSAMVGILFISPAPAEPLQRTFVPIDIVALVQAVFTGIAAVGGVFATIYSLLAAARAKRAEITAAASAATVAASALTVSKIKDTVELVERNTNSLTTQIANAARVAGIHEGEAKGKLAGEEAARTLAQGQKEGAATERASVAASVSPPKTASSS